MVSRAPIGKRDKGFLPSSIVLRGTIFYEGFYKKGGFGDYGPPQESPGGS